MPKNPKPLKNPTRIRSIRRRRHVRGFDGYSMIEALVTFRKTPNDLRVAMRKLVDDDALWTLIEEAHAANRSRRLLTDRVEKRIQQL